MLVLKKTAQFYVFDHVIRSEQLLEYEERAESLLDGLLINGCCKGGPSLFPRDKFVAAKESIGMIVRHLLSIYDGKSDEFVDFDRESWNVVRTPRINPGKHNIHFDPYDSEQHARLDEMARAIDLEDILGNYQTAIEKQLDLSKAENNSLQNRRRSCLRETGLSLTAPLDIVVEAPNRADATADTSDRDSCSKFRNGMELHSDGPRGENTVLMAFEPISVEQGPLLVSPHSHEDYIDGIGHDPKNVSAVESRISQAIENPKATASSREIFQYCYRPGDPMVIDSRTLHGALPNISSHWRVICWFIYECV